MRTLLRFALTAAFLSLGGCAFAGHTSSPWEWGGSLRVAPGLWSINQGDATVHPVASWTYLTFDGGNDQIFELGGQLRFPMGAANARSFWLGGETTFARLRTSVDIPGSGNFTASTNGYSITGLVGVPLGTNRWGPNIYAGAGLSDYGSQGWNIRVGLDLQPTFLWSN